MDFQGGSDDGVAVVAFHVDAFLCVLCGLRGSLSWLADQNSPLEFQTVPDSGRQWQCFESLVHSVVCRALDLLERIVRSGGNDGVGLPIGNLTSQWACNLMLDLRSTTEHLRHGSTLGLRRRWLFPTLIPLCVPCVLCG